MAGWKLKSIGVSGSEEVSLPAIGDRPQETARNAAPFRVMAAADEKSPGSVSIAPIHVGKSTVVTLTPVSKDSCRLHLKAEPGSPIRLEIFLHGTVLIEGLDRPRATAALRVPRSIAVKSGSAPLDIDVEFLAERDQAPALVPMLPIDRLGLWRVEEFSDGAETRTRVVSSLMSGTLFFQALDGHQRQLRENESLRPSGLKGVLRSTRLKGEAVALRYDGEVRGLLSGPEQHASNLMPSWLEFLRAQRPVALLWGAAMYCFGIVMAGLKWLKVKV
jgi:hypothetical protein